MKFYIIVVLTITGLAIRAAYIMRGGFYIGGEWLIPALAYIIYRISKSGKEKLEEKIDHKVDELIKEYVSNE